VKINGSDFDFKAMGPSQGGS